MAAHVFDYRLLRLLMGIIALMLPILVSVISSEPLTSISASYHTEARDVFVGLLFVVAALLVAYQGHTPTQNRVSNLAALAAVGIALFPVPDGESSASVAALVHYGCAALMFGILTWFCLGPFLRRTRSGNIRKQRRARIYRMCGWGILLSMIAMTGTMVFIPHEVQLRWEMVYWLETIALWFFGSAWITAGKVLPFLTNAGEALELRLSLRHSF